MNHRYSPLSAAVSPTLPDHINNIQPGDEIRVSGVYVGNGIPHIVLSHPLWEFRTPFLVRWVLRKEVGCIALLEVIETTKSANAEPRQIFVQVKNKNTVMLVSQPDFLRVLQVMCSDIIRRQHLYGLMMRKRFIDDVIFAFGQFNTDAQVVSPPVFQARPVVSLP